MARRSFTLALLLLTGATCHADFSRIVQAYKSVLTQGPADGSAARGVFSDMVSQEVANSPVSEFASAVPVVRECLRSESPAVRREALILLVVYNSRPDSAQLLEPYLDDLIKMLDDPAPGLMSSILRSGPTSIL
jgi:hypothetical protein